MKIRDFMGLEAYRPKKDAYKKMALHNHECLAPADLVQKDFRIWPRTVILTDITYFYYGMNKTPFYLCTFMDAYTREVLGSAVSRRMDTESLVKAAYDRMMEKHRDELGHAECLIHSDQGSQYLSSSFRELLKKDGILQSVSKRGCCTDNAPQERLWSLMKTHLLDIVAMAKDYLTAKGLIENYIVEYNTKNIQYSLAGLTPQDYYLYTKTGVYPLEKYFGVDAERLMTPEQLEKIRAERQKMENAYRNDAEARKKKRDDATAGRIRAAGPVAVAQRDKRLVTRLIDEAGKIIEKHQAGLEKYKGLLEKIDRAIEYLTGLGAEELARFMNRDEWKGQEELAYIYDMDRMFA